MSFILIRRTNYPLEGEGTSIISPKTNQNVKIDHDKWLDLSKTWHLGPIEGGTFWSLHPNRWIKHPQAKWTALIVYKETFQQYDVWMRQFGLGALGRDKGWIKLWPREFYTKEFNELEIKLKDHFEFYLMEKD